METLELPEVEERTDVDQGWQIILHNDEVNTFDHVIDCLVKYCKHSSVQAAQCAIIVHTNGKIDVKRGTYDKLAVIHETLLEKHLTTTLEEV